MEHNRATQLFEQNYTCSESVFLAVCQARGLETGTDMLSIALPFAGGLGRTGGLCGAVAGAAMAIGLGLGRGATKAESLYTMQVAAELRHCFEDAMGAINCRDLTGRDLTTPEALAEFINSDVPRKVCFPAVATAYTLTVELLQKSHGST